MGTDYAKELLHSHDRLLDEPAVMLVGGTETSQRNVVDHLDSGLCINGYRVGFYYYRLFCSQIFLNDCL